MWFSIAGYNTENCIEYSIICDERCENSCVCDGVGEWMGVCIAKSVSHVTRAKSCIYQ